MNPRCQDMTSPSPSCQCLVAGKGTPPGPGRADKTLPGHRRSGSYLVTDVPGRAARVLPPVPARQFGGKTRDPRSVRRRAKTGASGRTRPACAKVAVDHQRTTLCISTAGTFARTNPGGSVRRADCHLTVRLMMTTEQVDRLAAASGKASPSSVVRAVAAAGLRRPLAPAARRGGGRSHSDLAAGKRGRSAAAVGAGRRAGPAAGGSLVL